MVRLADTHRSLFSKGHKKSTEYPVKYPLYIPDRIPSALPYGMTERILLDCRIEYAVPPIYHTYTS